jgi:hypothetical protein
MVAFPFNYLVSFVWWINNKWWGDFRHKSSWIDAKINEKKQSKKNENYIQKTIEDRIKFDCILRLEKMIDGIVVDPKMDLVDLCSHGVKFRACGNDIEINLSIKPQNR